MKAKGVVITVAVSAAAVIGIAYGAGNMVKSGKTPVEVVAVPSINEGGGDAYAYSSSDQAGTIVSKDTQTVTLDTSHNVTEVYVKEGDTVRKGDRLLKYDMEADKLKREAEDLTRQGLELSLETMEKDLATMKSGKFPANYGSGDADPFFSGEVSSAGDADVSDGADVSDSGSDLTMSADTVGETSVKTGESVLLDDSDTSQGTVPDGGADSVILSDETQAAPGGSQEEADSGQGTASGGGDSGADDDIISQESGGDTIIDDANSTDDGSQVIADTPLEPTQEDLTHVNDFISTVNSLTDLASNGWEYLSSDAAAQYFSTAFDLYRNYLATPYETTTIDVFGESRDVTTYTVSDDMSMKVGAATAGVIQSAYDRLCVYQFINSVLQINPGYTNASSEYDPATVIALSDRIRTAVDALYQLQSGVCSYDENGNIVFSTEYSALNSTGAFSGEDFPQFLLGLVKILNQGTVITPDTDSTEPDTEPFTESPYIPPDNGGETESPASDLKTAIAEMEKNITECRLQIRESKLAVKDYDRTLAKETVTATMDGVVMQAGTTTTQPESGGFIVITGRKGLYVSGTISERQLESVKVGDTITGMSWDTGSSFSAEITEISQYPSDSNDSMYFYGSTDTSASMYPFLAFISDTEGLTTGSYVQVSIDTSGQEGGSTLMIEPYFIRTDENGKTFCYVRGDGGLLEKRYVRTKSSDYGAVSVLSGLRTGDYIAFPYGDDVKEGAATKIVDTLSSLNY